ncbi:MAG TPA: LpxL/LpxP family Kdo(2)-lipid IV(A) lauroyl/palmitoleoyl acyltransferase [Moraxellaceae bacterium]|nr:LpxL/LpxP family Kdo(2)-lipid IV(A) lauroyl/palmitoleoyl acyltransferase [Moraxellaceae bacterium]
MSAPRFDTSLLAPRHWAAWLLVGLVWLLAKLPWFLQRRLGAGIGWLLYRLLGRRVNDTRTNIRLCFPEKTAAEQEAMVRDIFRNAGLTLFESANAWFRSAEYYRKRFTLEGLEHLKHAQEGGRSVLLLGAHYSMLDLAARMASLYFTVDTVYRPQKNAVLEYVMTSRRLSYHGWAIPHDDTRRLIRALKSDHIVWYTPDQDFGLRHAVFAPFFGVSAATITTPTRLARVADSAVIMIHFHRVGDREEYRMTLSRPLENYPSGDEVADATRINKALEDFIRRAPTQYMWYHRRFKTVPPGGQFPYQYKAKELRYQREAAARKASEEHQ